MMQSQQSRRSEQGFTLVELAIVMVIIGLLIGGILKGQELINNAQITATVSQIKGLDAALNTFQGKYNALPGDMLTPSTRIPNCTAAPCSSAGNGNGSYANLVSAAPALGNEGVVAFSQLAAADLISGVNPTINSLSFGNSLPAVSAGGGMWLGASSATGGGPAGITTLIGNKSYVILNGDTGAPSTTSGALSPSAVAQIDRKLDDGLPRSGSTQAACNAGETGNTYQESVTTGTCILVSRVLN